MSRPRYLASMKRGNGDAKRVTLYVLAFSLLVAASAGLVIRLGWLVVPITLGGAAVLWVARVALHSDAAGRRRLVLQFLVGCQLFSMIPWYIRPTSEIVSQSNVTGLDSIRLAKAAVMLLCAILVTPSVVRFVSAVRSRDGAAFRGNTALVLYSMAAAYAFARTLTSLDANGLYGLYQSLQAYVVVGTTALVADSIGVTFGWYLGVWAGWVQAFLFGMIGLAAIGDGVALSQSALLGTTRLGGTVISPNALSVLAIVPFSRSLSLIAVGRHRLPLVFQFAIAALAIGLSRSTASSIAVMVVVLGILAMSRRWGMIVGLTLAVAFAVVAAGPYIVEVLLRGRELGNYFEHSTLTARISLWQASLTHLPNAKGGVLFGLGFGLAPARFFSQLAYWQPNFAHNVLVQKLVEGGVFYLGLLIALIVALFLRIGMRAVQPRGPDVVAAVAIYLFALIIGFGGDGFLGAPSADVFVMLAAASMWAPWRSAPSPASDSASNRALG